MPIRLRLIALAAAAACSNPADKPAPQGEKPPASGDTEVLLCDGKSKVTVPAGAGRDRESGKAVADALMAQWRQRHPGGEWEADVARAHPRIPPPADNRDVLSPDGQREGHAYGRYTEKDVLTWQREIERAVLEGARVFHDADALGSTVGVSCDMCHPDAANTHPETYPKFQVQLGRIVLLRDMINWCIEHPLRGTALAADDPRMRALEAYIYAQRKGAVLNYGKH
jgi:thiosulfate dehydrogenase